MASEDRFKATVVATIAKRAANQCSNPDCGALTSGPTDEPLKSVNVGEAAHIYGAHPGSARYDPAMQSADRGAITNAIWLCSTCHKLIDDDPERYPAGLLFEWVASHEQQIQEIVGKAGANLRRRYEKRHLEEFGKLSYLAERLIVEKGEYWEYRLTAEVLRFELAPIARRWRALRLGLYFKPSERIPPLETPRWVSMKTTEAQRIIGAFGELADSEFQRAWGLPGVPGNDVEIVATCRLYAEMCESALLWEESVRFGKLDGAFEELQTLMSGMVGMVIDEAMRLPEFISNLVGDVPQTGQHVLKLTLNLDEDYVTNLIAALGRGMEALGID